MYSSHFKILSWPFGRIVHLNDSYCCISLLYILKRYWMYHWTCPRVQLELSNALNCIALVLSALSIHYIDYAIFLLDFSLTLIVTDKFIAYFSCQATLEEVRSSFINRALWTSLAVRSVIMRQRWNGVPRCVEINNGSYGHPWRISSRLKLIIHFYSSGKFYVVQDYGTNEKYWMVLCK